MSDDLLKQAWFIVHLFRECDAIQLPHKPTEDVLTGMISQIETLAAELATARALIEALEGEQARADKAEAERDAAIAALGEAARLRGEAEGKLLAAEMPGVLEGWMRRAEKAEAALQRARDDALEEAAGEMQRWASDLDNNGYPNSAEVSRAGAGTIRAMKGKP